MERGSSSFGDVALLWFLSAALLFSSLFWGESQSTECVLQSLDLLKQLLTLIRESLDVHCSQGTLLLFQLCC